MDETKSRYELSLEEPQEAPQTKRCSKCGVVKELSEFHKDRTKSTGIDAACRVCSARPRKYKNANDRFWKQFWPRVEKAGQCLIWRGHTSNGQPACRYMRKTNARVRRIVYRLAVGDLPDDMFIITTCNNPLCVSQQHMRKVDRDSAVIKMRNNAAKGERHSSRTHPERVPRGERSGAAKLSIDQVREIHACRELGQSIDQIAATFQIHRMTAWRIVTLKTWAHVDGALDYAPAGTRGGRNGRAKLTEDDVRAIRILFEDGAIKNLSELARRFHIGRTHIRRIIEGKSWAHVQ